MECRSQTGHAVINAKKSFTAGKTRGGGELLTNLHDFEKRIGEDIICVGKS